MRRLLRGRKIPSDLVSNVAQFQIILRSAWFSLPMLNMHVKMFLLLSDHPSRRGDALIILGWLELQ